MRVSWIDLRCRAGDGVDNALGSDSKNVANVALLCDEPSTVANESQSGSSSPPTLDTDKKLVIASHLSRCVITPIQLAMAHKRPTCLLVAADKAPSSRAATSSHLEMACVMYETSTLSH